MRIKKVTWGEFAVVMLMIAVYIALLSPMLSQQREMPRRKSCQNNLKTWALLFKMYSNESKDELWPPLQEPFDLQNPRLGLAPDINSIYPNYLTDPSIIICPSNPKYNDLVKSKLNHSIDLPSKLGGCAEELDDSYVYWGWAFDKVSEKSINISIDPVLAAYAGIKVDAILPLQVKGAIQSAHTAYTANNPLKDPGDYTVSDGAGGIAGNAESNTVYRLREGVERFLITDINDKAALQKAQATLPVMHDLLYTDPGSANIISNHKPTGMNVLYFDMHVTFISSNAQSVNPHVAFLEYGKPQFSETFSDAYLSALVGALTN